MIDGLTSFFKEKINKVWNQIKSVSQIKIRNTRGSLASLGPLNIHTSLYHHVVDRFTVGRVCSATSRVIFGQQSVFCQFSGQFLVGRVCSAASQDDFRSAECVLLCPGSISDRQSVFCHILDQFPVGRVYSATSRVIFSQDSVFRQFSVQFPVGRVCSATSWVDSQSAECVPPRPG